MKRIPVNPWEWSKQYQFNQGEILEGVSRQLVCSGQTLIDAEGKVQHPDDLRGQIAAAMDNLEAVLKAAEMGFEHLTRLTVYTTDVDKMIENWDAFSGPLAVANVMPVNTLIGVARLAYPELKVEIQADAAD